VVPREGPDLVYLSHASFVDSTVTGALAAAGADQDGMSLKVRRHIGH
jgi:hypothetical protein